MCLGVMLWPAREGCTGPTHLCGTGSTQPAVVAQIERLQQDVELGRRWRIFERCMQSMRFASWREHPRRRRLHCLQHLNLFCICRDVRMCAGVQVCIRAYIDTYTYAHTLRCVHLTQISSISLPCPSRPAGAGAGRAETQAVEAERVTAHSNSRSSLTASPQSLVPDSPASCDCSPALSRARASPLMVRVTDASLPHLRRGSLLRARSDKLEFCDSWTARLHKD